MPVTPTYPGIYIEELPSSVRTITAAPTSITVFVGYVHPFKTDSKIFNTAVRIFNFTDYERTFGGFFISGSIDPSLPQAVNQFFLNGGSDAYVVGLKPHYSDLSTGTSQGDVKPASLSIGDIKFTARELIDLIPLTVTISLPPPPSPPLPPSSNDRADITITYGSRVETYRKVTLNSSDKQNYLPIRINGNDRNDISNPISSLVTVSPLGSGSSPYGTSFTAINQIPLDYTSPLSSAGTTFNRDDFTQVFAADSSLDKVPIFNLLVLPGIADNSIWSEALAFCERKLAFLILDPPRQDSADGVGGLPKIEDDMQGFVIPKSTNGALYFPYLQSTDPATGNAIEAPPSGFVAGIYARTDLNRGVWKAPAGLETVVLNTTGVVERGVMTDQRQGILNPIGVNCLRSFPGIGTVVYGARTLVSGNTALQQWWYVPVRRMALFIEQTLIRNLGWVVFEPNDEPLWAAIRLSIEGFMLSLFNQGAFQGSTPSQAFQVKCDKSTTTQQDIDNGIVNIVVAFAPLKPAEFVIIKIAQLAGQVQS